MALYEEFVDSGQWLFQRRSWLPIAGVALLLTQVWVAAAAGRSHFLPDSWPFICFGISFVGLVLRAYTVGCAAPGTSGRNRGKQVADSLNTTGPYSVVRHPLYLANAIMWLGPALYPQRGWLVAVLALAFWLYYERIMFAEEEFLRGKYGATFTDWAARAPAFLPNFRLWQPPREPFQIRVVLRREYTGLLLLVVLFAALDFLHEWVAAREWEIETFWEWSLIVGGFLAVGLRMLRRHSTLLEDRPPKAGP